MEKAIFSCIHRFQHTSYADTEGMRENGYEGMPPVQEMITSLSLCGETSSLKNEFSALQSSLSVELAVLPSPRGSPMSMPLPSERFEFPLILRNEFSALQSSLSVELASLPSP